MRLPGTLRICLGLTISCIAAGSARAQGPATQLVFSVQPSTTTAQAIISPAVEVEARDSAGQPATGFNGRVTISITSGTGAPGAALFGIKTVTAVDGVATFPNLAIDDEGVGYMLSARAPDVVGGGTSAPFDVLPDVAGIELVFTTQPSTVAEKATIRPSVQVTARERSGRTARRFTRPVTLSITRGTGAAGAVLSGSTTVTAIAGVATFTNLSIDNGGTGYILSASAAGLTGTSAPFDITGGDAPPPPAVVSAQPAPAPAEVPAPTPAVVPPAPPAAATAPGAATELVFTVQPSAAAEEATIRPAVQVTARDASGQTATSFTGRVTLSIATGTGDSEAELLGTRTVNAVAGVATFPTLSIDNAATGYILSAAATGLPRARSAPFAIMSPDAAPAPAAATPAPAPVVPAAATPATPAAADETPDSAAAEDSTPAAGEDEPAPAPAEGAALTLRASALPTSAFDLDGKLDEPAWQSADSIVNLVTIEPEEGGAPAGQTVVKVLANSGELVIGVLSRDPNPTGIVAYSKARDAELEFEDHVVIVLDAFQDGRSGYVFAVNPNGARFDGLVIAQGEDVNSDWDAVWEARTARDSRGWSAEIRIPIRSLSFKKGLNGWGFNVQRRVQRLQETSRWAGASRDYEIYQTNHAGLLTNLPPFEFGFGLSIRPATVGSASRPSPDESREYTGDFSLDVTKKIGSNLLASATINTDFGETEVDARQTNLTRFDVFFPEKRPFFLEGADIFEFGLGLDEDLLMPFFTRRIGVSGEEEDLEQIPITFGGKVNGRIGNTNVGALAVRTGSVDTVFAEATMGAVRIKQNVLEESSVGVIATFGDQLGNADSWMAGADFTYRTSNFGDEKNLLVGVWGLANNRADLQGDKVAYGARIEYPNDLWDLSAAYTRIGDAFQPSLGFVPRTGRILTIGGDFKPRPEWPLVRQMIYEANFFLVTDLENNWESYLWTIKPIDWRTESGDRASFTILPEGEQLTDSFDIADEVFIPPGTYRWTQNRFEIASAEKRAISGLVAFSYGDFYQGTLNTFELKVVVKPSSSFAFELSQERNTVKLPQGNFTTELVAGRIEFKYSPDFQISSFLQYDNESRNFGTNTRLRWTFNPLGDVFVVFNHNMLRHDNNRLAFESNQLLVKVQYAFRF
jgi:hypothetical protein